MANTIDVRKSKSDNTEKRFIWDDSGDYIYIDDMTECIIIHSVEHGDNVTICDCGTDFDYFIQAMNEARSQYT